MPPTFRNPSPDRLRALLRDVRSIAVVGFSPDPSRPSHRVASALQRVGYRIIPVRPGIASGLGETAYPDLAAIPDAARVVDLVDVFRASDQVMPVVDACIALGLKRLWLQDGVVNEAAAARACAAGIEVVMDDCTWRAWSTLGVGTRGDTAGGGG